LIVSIISLISHHKLYSINTEFTGCGNLGGKRKNRILSEEKPTFLLVRMQRWCGFAKDDGDIRVPAGFEIRDILDNNDIKHYGIVGLVATASSQALFQPNQNRYRLIIIIVLLQLISV
jgi:hypothetical protein